MEKEVKRDTHPGKLDEAAKRASAAKEDASTRSKDQRRRFGSKASKYKASVSAMESKLQQSRLEKKSALAKFLAAKEKLKSVQAIKSGGVDACKHAEKQAVEREKRMKSARARARKSIELAKEKAKARDEIAKNNRGAKAAASHPKRSQGNYRAEAILMDDALRLL